MRIWRRICCAVLAGGFLAGAAGAKEILYIHNTHSGEISKVSIPGHEVIGEIPIGLYTDYVAVSPDQRTLYV
ncbi:MAG: YncE family protein, partial [Steroidobacteraceae bacterium]